MAKYRGGFKVMEEAAEVIQILAKLGPFPSGNHPDCKGDLHLRLEDELADLEAAITYLRESADLLPRPSRTLKKLYKFREWGLTGFNDEDQA